MRRYSGGKLSLDVQHDLRTEMLGALSRLDGARQDEIHTGQLVSRSISDINMIQGLLSFLPITIGSALLFVVSIVIMLSLSPLLTLVALAVAPALWVIALRSRRKLFPASWHAQQQSGEVAAIVDESVGGVRVVKGFGQEDQELERMEGASTHLYAVPGPARTPDGPVQPRAAGRPHPRPGRGAGARRLAGHRGLHHASARSWPSPPTSRMMSGPVRMLTALVTIGQEARASVIRVLEVIDSRPGDHRQARRGAAAGRRDRDRVRRRPVRLRAVRTGAARPVAARRPGRDGGGGRHLRLGQVDDLAAAAALLRRERGRRPGRRPRRAGRHPGLAARRHRARHGGQLPVLRHRRANIAYGRPDATDEQILAAARAAEADEFITDLPQGYDTVIGEQGLTLSGGQRQRVALARALITDPRLLLLDDATSAIDPRLEAEIHATLSRVMQGRTTLLIAHRRSTLNLADRIAVLDNGQVADFGTHEELTDRCPLYRLLLSGPGDDVEGIDAGELAYYENDEAPSAALERRPGDSRAVGCGQGAAARRAGRTTRAPAAATDSTAPWVTCRPLPNCSPRSTRCRQPAMCPRSARSKPAPGTVTSP